MKITSAVILALTATTASTFASPDPHELAVAHEIKLYIAKEHMARKSDPKIDFEKLDRLCGTSQNWTKGCRLWKATGGKDKYMLQVRPKGKIYGIPSMFQ